MKNLKLLQTKSFIIFVLFILVTLSVFAQIEKVHIDFERINNNVLVVWGGKVYKDQVVAIATDKEIVLIDTGKSPSLTALYRTIIEREFGRNDFSYIINTHYHFDHTSGNQVFPEAIVISNDKTPALMREWADNRMDFVKERRSNQMRLWNYQRGIVEPDSQDWLRFNDYITTGQVMLDDYENNYELKLPDITFNDRLTLEHGNLTLQLYYFGEGKHTGDDIIIYCPEEKLVFSGDLFYKGTYAFADDANFEGERWISVLTEIFDGNDIEWVYDNHNGRMPGTFIRLLTQYMTDIWNSLSKAKNDGMDFQAIETIYSYESRFSYIEKSGLNPEILRNNHINNLKYTWERINNK